MRSTKERRTLALALGGCAIAVFVLAWLARDEPARSTPSSAERSTIDPVRPTSMQLADDGQAPLRNFGDGALPAREPAIESAQEPAPASKTFVERVTAEFALQASFHRPDGHEVKPAVATVDVVDESGDRRQVTVRNAASVTVEGLPLGRYAIDVRAEGFEHRAQDFEVNADDLGGRSGSRLVRGLVRQERIVLWPTGWIAVAVRTPDGKPFHEIAVDLGIEPKRLFVGAFGVHARLSPPEVGVPETAVLAKFRPSHGWQSWQVIEGVIGSLELVHAPPLWVGLDVLDAPLGWELLRPGETEVVFELDRAGFEERCARLRLRVVDAVTRAPLPDARVTLRADTSAHRRDEHQDVSPRADGTVELERILPGRYELSIVRDAAPALKRLLAGDTVNADAWVEPTFAQRRLEFVARETRDLGDVALESGRTLDVRVDTDDGAHATAWVEIAPYEPGASVDAVYPPMLHRHTHPDGRYALPIPGGRSVVRASIEPGRSLGIPSSGAYSSNVLVDRAALPASPLVLVVREPVEVTLETSLHALESIEVRDDLDLVVALPPVGGQKALRCELVPGRYRARFFDANGNLVGATPFEVGTEAVRVIGP